MSAMPERVWLICDPANNEPGEYTVIDPGQPERLAPCYVPESRLLAAEARVREMEEQASRPVPLDYGRHPITDARRDFIHHALTYPGFVGNRDLFVEAARDLAAEAATLRADLDALVPLARFAMRVHDTGDNTADAAVADGVLVWVSDSECDESPAFTRARAILAREET